MVLFRDHLTPSYEICRAHTSRSFHSLNVGRCACVVVHAVADAESVLLISECPPGR